MKRQLQSSGPREGEENHSKSMWDVLSFTNLSSQSRPNSFWRKSEELQRMLPFVYVHQPQKKLGRYEAAVTGGQSAAAAHLKATAGLLHS